MAFVDGTLAALLVRTTGPRLLVIGRSGVHHRPKEYAARAVNYRLYSGRSKGHSKGTSV